MFKQPQRSVYKWTSMMLVFAFVLGASGVSAAQAAGQTKTTTAISFSSPGLVGEPLTVTATVEPAPNSGTVDFSATLNDAMVTLPAECGAVPISGASVTCTFTPDSQGAYTFKAKYSGSAIHKKSNGQAVVTVLVPTVPVPTTTVVTDNATTIPGGPAPVKFGETIVFTAAVNSAAGAPNGTVRWTLSHQGSSYADSGSGIIGACQGDIPVVNGVATCSVTPGYWYDSGNGMDMPFFWAIDATATFTPAAGSLFLGSTGSDSTNKITLGEKFLPWCGSPGYICPEPYVVVEYGPGDYVLAELVDRDTNEIDAEDSLGRPIDFYWCVGLLPCPDITTTPTYWYEAGAYSGIHTVSLVAACPQGVTSIYDNPGGSYENWHGSFECNYWSVSVILKNEHQSITP